MASGTWTSVATSGVWSTAANWSGTTIADGSSSTASFTSNITATTTIDTTIGGGWSGTIGNLTFSDSGANGFAWTLGTQSTITLGSLSTITTTTAATINGILAGGAAGLTKAGAQTLTLAGANTFSGSITINEGTLSATSTSALGLNTARAITVASGAAISTGAAVTGSNFNTQISGTGVLGVNPTGNGAVIVATTSTANLGVITLNVSSSIRASSSGTLAGTITVNAGLALTLQAPSGITGTVSAPIGGLGGLVVGGDAAAVTQTGTVTLSSLTNGYSGDTTVSTGTLTVSGLLGSGSYTGNISIASGATFSFSSSSNQTLSGGISGLGTLTKVTGTSSILTLSGTNSYSALNIQAGTVSVASIANNVGSGVSAINVGLTGTTGTLRYTGSGETTSKVINLAGNTTGGAIIENNGSGVLVFTSAITGVSATGTRTLTLSGSNAGVNDFQGIIANVGGGAGLTAFTKAGVGYWKLTGVNTFTGNVSVTGGQLEIPALTALGSGTKTISISLTNRNASMLLSGAGVTYPSTLSWSLNTGVSGQDQTNNPLGAIRALANSTIAGAVTLTATSTVYADTGNLTFNGLVTGAFTFGLRAATGQTITVAGGLGTAGMTPYLVGPGTVVWNGVDANAVTNIPVINGGTLRQVVTRSTAVTPIQFAHTSVSLGSAANQTAAISSRYQYTGGTLEISNSGAAGAVDYTGLSSTSAINLSRGSGKLKLSRDSTAGSFTVRLGNSTSNTPGIGVLTLEYAGTTGIIGTDSSIIFSALDPNAAYARIIISDGAGSFVPAYFDASRVAVPMVYGGGQSNVAASQAGGTTLALLSTAFGNYNLTGDITAQETAATSTLRLATSVGTPITLAAGANLQSVFLMDMGTGTARTIVAGASGAKLSRSTATNASNVLGIWTENLASPSGATISADMDARFNAAFTKAGVGILSFTGAVANLSGINIAEGTFRIGSAGTFNSTFGNITLGNVYAASGTTVAAEFNQTGDVVVAGLSGGGANTAVTLSAATGDLVLRSSGTAATPFGGNIVLGGSQKLKVKTLGSNSEASNAIQAFQGAFPFTAIEMSRGYISLDPQYGATVTGTPSVTATGGSVVAIQAQNPLEADYTITLGALAVSSGALQVRLANVTASTNSYATRITASSLTVTGDSVALLLNTSPNSVQSFTVTGTPAGPMGNGVNVYNNSNVAYYRTVGQALFVGGGAVAPAGGTVDVPVYGTDANFSASKGAGTSFTSAGVNDNINVTGAQSAQTSVTMKSLRTSANITMASASDRLTTDLISFASTGIISGGEIASQTGNLYINSYGGAGNTISSNIVNGAVPTKVILHQTATSTISGVNTYSGGTLLQGGSSVSTISGASPLGTGSITGNGGAGFTLPASTNFTLSNDIVLNDGGLRLDAPTVSFGYTLQTGVISGSGDLYLAGNGNFAINGASNTANGTLRLTGGGTVTLGAAQAFTEYDFNNSSLTFRYGTGYTTDISALATKRPNNTYRIDTNGQSVTWASSVGNGSTYIKTGAGTHTLAAENFFASATVSTGTVQAGNVAALGYGNVTLSAGTTLQTLTTGGQNGKLTITGTLTNSAGGTIRIGG